MKRKVSKLLALLMCVFTGLTFAACAEGGNNGNMSLTLGPSGIGRGLAPGYGSSIAEAVVVLDGYGKVKSVRIDEIYGPDYAADFRILLNDGNTATSNDANFNRLTDTQKELFTKFVSTSGTRVSNNYYRNHLSIGGKIFTLEVTGDDPNQSYVYKSEDINDLSGYIATEEGMWWYVDAILNKTAFYCNAAGVAQSGITNRLRTRYHSNNEIGDTEPMRKRSGSYTMSGNFYTLYQGLDALEAYLTEYGFYGLKNGAVEIGNNGRGMVYVDGFATGATLTSGNAYLEAALNAYNKAVENRNSLIEAQKQAE